MATYTDINKWYPDLISFLKTKVLPMTRLPPADIDKITDLNVTAEDTRVGKASVGQSWINAFIHQSISITQNYEVLEKIGDRVLKLTFNTYIADHYPQLSQRDLARYEAYYTAKDYLGNVVSPQLDLPRWVLSSMGITKSIREDVFESLMGALFETSERALGPGAGYVATYNLTAAIWSQVPLDPNILLGDAKTQIKELFEKLYPPKTYPKVKIVKLENGSYQTTLSVDDTVLRDLKQLNPEAILPSIVLGVGTGLSQRQASKHAYETALDLLNSIGITAKWADEISLQQLAAEKGVAQVWATVMRKIKENNFDRITFSPLEIGVDQSRYILLIGITKDGRRQKLTQAKGSPGTDTKTMKIKVLEKYASR